MQAELEDCVDSWSLQLPAEASPAPPLLLGLSSGTARLLAPWEDADKWGELWPTLQLFELKSR